MQTYLATQTDDLVQAVQRLVSSIRDEEVTRKIRDDFSSIIDLIETLIAVSEGAMDTPTSFQHALRSQIHDAYQALNARRVSFEKLARDLQEQDGQPSVRDLVQSLPPLVFAAAREARDLVTKMEGVTYNQGQDLR